MTDHGYYSFFDPVRSPVMAGSNLSSAYIAPHHPAAQISKLPKSHA
jgi:hypothetical protein